MSTCTYHFKYQLIASARLVYHIRYSHLLFSSYCSGIVAASLSSPADLVKARVMNQPFDERGRPLVYKSSVDCLLKTVRNEGFFGLYKGFLPCYIRMVGMSQGCQNNWCSIKANS